MGKRQHPHRFMLIEKRTWKCMLPGCSYFVHLGLAHALLGKLGACWECGEEFVIDQDALKDEMPRCVDCRLGIDADELDNYNRAKLALAKAGVKRVKDLDPQMRRTIEAIHGVNFDVLERNEAEVVEEKDEIEVIEPNSEHALDCEIHVGGDCTCGRM